MDCATDTTVFQYAGDVAGVGVRLSFYIQNFILGTPPLRVLEVDVANLYLDTRQFYS